MRRHAGSILLAFATGLALVWLARWERRAPVREVHGVASSIGPRLQAPALSASVPPGPAQGSAPLKRTSAAAASAGMSVAAAEQGPAPSYANPPLIPAARNSPAGAAAASGRPAALDALLKSATLSCRFDPGNGSEWRGGNMTVHSASWQGGPIIYDSIDTQSGSAQMEGTQGATGSQTGETDVHVVATATGLHFAGFTLRGELVVTTVYAALDAGGHYMAVMSRHGADLQHESAQFYGSCDTTLVQRDAAPR